MHSMQVSNYFLIGNMTVPSSWVALIIAFAIAYSLVRFKFEKRVAEKMSDLIFYFIIVWKFSVLITNFETVIQSPLSIIYFHGGRVGIFLGLFVVGIKVLIEINKNRLNKDDVVVLFLGSVIIQVVYQLTMVLLNEGALLVQLMTLVIFIPFAVFTWLAIKRADGSLSQLSLLFAAIHLFVSSFQPAGILGTSVIATVTMSLFFVVFDLVFNFNRREISE